MTTSEEYLEQLAAEWKQTAEEYRADLQVERDRSRAQAAVIERVRALVAPLPHVGKPETASVRALENALAAAPEHTGPECNCYLSNGAHRTDCPQWYTAEERLKFSPAAEAHLSGLERAGDLAAAKARVAELEESEARAVARAKDIEAECVRVERRVIAANARADAAERAEANMQRTEATYAATIRELQSEVAALRAEVERLRIDASIDQQGYRDAVRIARDGEKAALARAEAAERLRRERDEMRHRHGFGDGGWGYEVKK